MEYNERDISDDEQIVEEDEHYEDNKNEEQEEEEHDEPEDEEYEELEGGEGVEKNPWVGIQDKVEEWHKEKLEALISEFQKILQFRGSGSC